MRSTMPTILCCECSAPIQANSANMCISCLQKKVDVTEGITKEVTMYQCRGCLKWQRPPWVSAELESTELMAICLKKINGLSHVKLADASWIWTEPHSKRLKIKLTIQKEVMHGTILQQSFVVTFIVRNQQCDECQALYSNQAWKAVVQVRQKVDHKRTFYFLEQLILKHNAHEKATSIKSFPDGIDFYFGDRSQALRFVDFLQECVPIKLKKAKKLISADNHSNTHNFKFTYAVDIAPVCKDDLVILPSKLAQNLGNIAKVCLVSHVSSSIHLVDPLSLQKAEIDSEKYWRYPFEALRSCKAMILCTVLDSTPAPMPMRNGRPIQRHRGARLADMEVVRESDFGVNDTTYYLRSHLGLLVKSGDTVMGYDLTNAVFNDQSLKALNDSEQENLPDIVLVRKFFPKSRKTKRQWHLKTMDGVTEEESNKKRELNRSEEEYERFLEDLEHDKSLRSQINIYKSAGTITQGNAVASTIPIEELLDELTTSEATDVEEL